MKKALLVGFVLTMTYAVNAQYFGVQGGGSLVNLSDKTDAYSVNTRIKPGFFMGIITDFPLNNDMAISTALNFKHAGTWIKENNDVWALRLNYINLDVTYNYIITLSSITLFLEGGGYMAYAVGGKTIYRPESGDNVDTKIDFGTSTDDDLKPFDAGLIIGGGVFFGKAKLGINYCPGLINLTNQEDWISRNFAIMLKAAYFFNRE